MQNIQQLTVTYTDITIQPSWTSMYKRILYRDDSPKKKLQLQSIDIFQLPLYLHHNPKLFEAMPKYIENLCLATGCTLVSNFVFLFHAKTSLMNNQWPVLTIKKFQPMSHIWHNIIHNHLTAKVLQVQRSPLSKSPLCVSPSTLGQILEEL
jgi:hypothetical protein